MSAPPARLARRLAAKRLPVLNISQRPFSLYSAKQSDPQRQQITLSRGGDGKKWAGLSTTQKAGRAASTGANLLTIIVGVGLTGAVFTLLYLEVFAPDSAANWFNRIHKRIRDEQKCTDLLGDGRKIKAYGEPTSNRWSRNRPIASTTKKDKYGIEHLIIRFNVEGDIDKGVVSAHLVKLPGEHNYKYRYLYLDVAGKPRVYLESADGKPSHESGRKRGLFGVQWGW